MPGLPADPREVVVNHAVGESQHRGCPAWKVPEVPLSELWRRVSARGVVDLGLRARGEITIERLVVLVPGDIHQVIQRDIGVKRVA
eukprot:2615117-Pyramimonas_sp.AAC.1